MKKTTKILLVLAAVVAMTIGAVSTVMAADESYPTIGEWIEVKNVGWQANDTEGEPIVRGWATKDGFWYFFDSSLMLVNTFVTWNEEVYYLDGQGHMAIGWIGFDDDATSKDKAKYDTEINTVDKHEKEKYANIREIGTDFNMVFVIEDADAVGNTLDLPKGDTNVLWCYFKEDGTLAQHEWYEAWGLWYFSYGAFAVLGDYQVAIELNGSDQTDNKKFLAEDGEGFYGFAADGHMLVGWEKYVEVNEKAQNGALTDDDTPYEDKGADKAEKTTSYWTYYHTNGRQVNTTPVDPKAPNTNKYNDDIYEGWELIDGNWTYFVQDFDYGMEETLGMVLLQNDFVYDDYTDDGGKLDPNGNKGTFYVDANGYLVRGLKTFAKDTVIGTWEENVPTSGSIKFAAAAGTFMFGEESGNMLYGIQDKFYFLTDTADDYVYEVIQDTKDVNCNVPSKGQVVLTQSVFDKDIKGVTGTDMDYVVGQRLDGKNFFVVVDEAVLDINWDADDKTDKVFIYYFESGRMQKNQAITFGEVTIAIDANGCVVTAAKDNKVTVAGHQFVLEPGVAANSITLDGYVIPGLKK